MRTTIKDIANYTGFSVATISLVLNQKATKIPQHTKDLILEAADKLNYHPNQLAVGLVKKRTETIGLVISDVSNVFFSNLAKGVEDACRKKGWNLILCNTNDKHSRELAYIQVLADKGVDGILFCMAQDSTDKKAKESVELLERLKLPFVMIDRFLEETKCSAVTVNHKSGGYMATNHLLSLGHKKIGCLAGPLQLRDCIGRLEGYEEALREHNIEYDKSLIFEGNYDKESGVLGADYFLEKKVSAIFAFNDMSAYGAYHQLKKRGISIPKEMALVGYDNIFFSELLDVPLTTVHQPIYEMGVEAVRQLIEEVEEEAGAKRRIVFQPELIIRKSAGESLL